MADKFTCCTSAMFAKGLNIGTVAGSNFYLSCINNPSSYGCSDNGGIVGTSTTGLPGFGTGGNVPLAVPTVISPLNATAVKFTGASLYQVVLALIFLYFVARYLPYGTTLAAVVFVGALVFTPTAGQALAGLFNLTGLYTGGSGGFGYAPTGTAPLGQNGTVATGSQISNVVQQLILNIQTWMGSTGSAIATSPVYDNTNPIDTSGYA